MTTSPSSSVPQTLFLVEGLVWGTLLICVWRFLHKVWRLLRDGVSAAVTGAELTPPPELLPSWLDRANTVVVSTAAVTMAWLSMALSVSVAVTLAVSLTGDATALEEKLGSVRLLEEYRGAAAVGQMLGGSLSVLLVARWVSENSVAAVGWTRRGLFRAVMAGLDGLASVLPLLMATLYVSTLFLPVQSHPILKELGEAPAPARQWALLLSAVLVAPVTEELFFRGLLQSAVRCVLTRFLRRGAAEPGRGEVPLRQEEPVVPHRPVGNDSVGHGDEEGSHGVPSSARWGAILGTSVLFALAHWSVPHSLPSLFLLSVAMGLVFERTGSIAAPVTLHMAFNGVNVLLQLQR